MRQRLKQLLTEHANVRLAQVGQSDGMIRDAKCEALVVSAGAWASDRAEPVPALFPETLARARFGEPLPRGAAWYRVSK